MSGPIRSETFSHPQQSSISMASRYIPVAPAARALCVGPFLDMTVLD